MLKANGKIYELGDDIGLTNCRISDISVLKEAIKAKTVPLVSDFGNDTDKVIGHADLSVADNAIHADLTLYSEEDKLDPDLRLGFFATGVKTEKDEIGELVKSMVIRSVSLNHMSLGGHLENLRKK